MKIRLRSKSVKGATNAQRQGQAVRRRAPSSALTTWLRQGLRTQMCPLCRVAHKADREYIWHFFDEGADQADAIAAVRQACGFCAEHIEMLRRIEVDGMKSTLALSTMFADVLSGVVADLDSLDAGDSFQPAPCPACANRKARLAVNARYLLDELATSPVHRETFESSPGLCFPHFRLTWKIAPTTQDRELILAVQRRATHRVLDDLREHVRKQDDRYRHEPKGAEHDSWQGAIWLTSGWPRPAATAAEPEAGR